MQNVLPIPSLMRTEHMSQISQIFHMRINLVYGIFWDFKRKLSVEFHNIKNAFLFFVELMN